LPKKFTGNFSKPYYIYPDKL